MTPARNHRKAKESTVVPCQYDCGRPAQGILMINYTAFDASEDYYRHGFSVSLPCCRECLKNAVRVTFTIPEVATK